MDFCKIYPGTIQAIEESRDCRKINHISSFLLCLPRFSTRSLSQYSEWHLGHHSGIVLMDLVFHWCPHLLQRRVIYTTWILKNKCFVQKYTWKLIFSA